MASLTQRNISKKSFSGSTITVNNGEKSKKKLQKQQSGNLTARPTQSVKKNLKSSMEQFPKLKKQASVYALNKVSQSDLVLQQKKNNTQQLRMKSNSTIKENISRIDDSSLKGWSEKPISMKNYREMSTDGLILEEDPIEVSLQLRMEVGGQIDSLVNNLFTQQNEMVYNLRVKEGGVLGGAN